ncbi:hypothetical protein NPIL_587031 [Nephila pilipes]|uniref:Uncharacterized protein n=1 Tax=Nephila pilipes TaxID=299642 RepID=A0A8X6U221_NEPPI|nr:hypothetical protein NPIL_587031 [Nephila pilipes]
MRQNLTIYKRCLIRNKVSIFLKRSSHFYKEKERTALGYKNVQILDPRFCSCVCCLLLNNPSLPLLPCT